MVRFEPYVCVSYFLLLVVLFISHKTMSSEISVQGKITAKNLDVSHSLKVGGVANLKGAVKADYNLYVGDNLFVDKTSFLKGGLTVQGKIEGITSFPNITFSETQTGRTYNGKATYITSVSTFINTGPNKIHDLTVVSGSVESLVSFGGTWADGADDHQYAVGSGRIASVVEGFKSVSSLHQMGTDIVFMSSSLEERTAPNGSKNSVNIWVEYTKIEKK
jgi:hypothetical protein